MSLYDYNGECPQCKGLKVRFHVDQGDHMRVTGGPTIRAGVKGHLMCLECHHEEHSAWVDVTLEFGEAIR